MKKIYFDNLDRWRFFAAFVVIASHYVTVFSESDRGLTSFLRIALTLDGAGAEAGVSFFFVLSGFLITGLLLQEQAETGTIAVGRFYMRRVLRIWPLYYVTMLIGFVLVPFILGSAYYEIASWKWYALFLANFDQIYHWGSSLPNPLLGVHWSLAVEEQFYLIWPWLLLLTGIRFPWFAISIVVVSFTFEWMYPQPTHTISCLHDLAIGGLAAYGGYKNKEQLKNVFAGIASWLIAAVYVSGAALVILKFQLSIHFPFYHHLYRSLHVIFFAFIILDQSFNARNIFWWLPSWFSFLGQISYGLYLLHPIALFMVHSFLPETFRTFWIQFPLVVILSIVLSTLSYLYFEKFFLKLKQKF